jgi:hypothetical protein
MVGGRQLINIGKHNVVAQDIVAQEIDVIDCNVISEVGADDGAIIKANGHPEIVKLEKVRFQFADPDEAKKIAPLYQLSVEFVSDKNVLPVIRSIVIGDELLDLYRRQFSIYITRPVLNVPEVILVFSFWNVFGSNKVVTERRDWLFVDLIHDDEVKFESMCPGKSFINY